MANYSFESTNAVQTVTIGKTGTYDIAAYSAQGGNDGSTSSTAQGTEYAPGGTGAETGVYLNLAAGEKLKIVVGAEGMTNYNSGGGGGGSFVLASTNGGASYSLLLASGGGGASLIGGGGFAGGGATSANSAAGSGAGGTAAYGGGGAGLKSGSRAARIPTTAPTRAAQRSTRATERPEDTAAGPIQVPAARAARRSTRARRSRRRRWPPCTAATGSWPWCRRAPRRRP